MLKRQDLSAAEQPAAVVDELIIYSLEHIYVNLCKLQLLQFGKALVCFIKIYTLANGYLITLCTPCLLQLLIAEVICLTYLRKVVHILGA